MNNKMTTLYLKDDFKSAINDSSDRSSDNSSTKITVTETNSLLKDDMGTISVEKDVIISKDEFLSGNHKIKYEERRRIGNMWAFWYKNGEPKILIGPHCIIRLYK